MGGNHEFLVVKFSYKFTFTYNILQQAASFAAGVACLHAQYVLVLGCMHDYEK